MIIRKGMKFKATHKNASDVLGEVISTNVKNDGRGTIAIQLLNDDLRVIVVEENWFNTELTGRKIKQFN